MQRNRPPYPPEFRQQILELFRTVRDKNQRRPIEAGRCRIWTPALGVSALRLSLVRRPDHRSSASELKIRTASPRHAPLAPTQCRTEPNHRVVGWALSHPALSPNELNGRVSHSGLVNRELYVRAGVGPCTETEGTLRRTCTFERVDLGRDLSGNGRTVITHDQVELCGMWIDQPGSGESKLGEKRLAIVARGTPTRERRRTLATNNVAGDVDDVSLHVRIEQVGFVARTVTFLWVVEDGDPHRVSVARDHVARMQRHRGAAQIPGDVGPPVHQCSRHRKGKNVGAAVVSPSVH